REWSDESEEEPKEETEKEPEEAWVVDTLCRLKMKLKRERVSPVLPEDYKAFNTLLDSSPPNFLSWQKKRDWSGKSEEELKEETEKERTPEPEETWVLDSLCGLKMKIKRRRVSPVLPESYDAFNTLLGRRTPQKAPPILFFSPWIICRKRKREWSDESEEDPKEETEKERTPEPEETWVLETLQGLKMKIKRRRVSPVLPEHHQAFNRLLEDPVVKRFLAWDTYLRASDK
ncbi:Speedy protein E3, partial [Saguinus oedipus]